MPSIPRMIRQQTAGRGAMSGSRLAMTFQRCAPPAADDLATEGRVVPDDFAIRTYIEDIPSPIGASAAPRPGSGAGWAGPRRRRARRRARNVRPAPQAASGGGRGGGRRSRRPEPAGMLGGKVIASDVEGRGADGTVKRPGTWKQTPRDLSSHQTSGGHGNPCPATDDLPTSRRDVRRRRASSEREARWLLGYGDIPIDGDSPLSSPMLPMVVSTSGK
jgi:hypothetical protein